MADESTPASPTSETPPPRTTGGNWRWEPPTAQELQALMPGYTIEKLLGRGGMGAVYRGVQTNLDRPVAIKILPPGVEKEDPSFAERFKSEARLMARLSNPAVVAVYDFGTNAAGQLYFAMEYVDGSDVSQMIAAQGKLPPEHALAITAHVCDALSAAHELGIVHRDIKPANVLINMKGQVKVADFGLAKIEDPGQHGLTKTGYAMGTPDFVAPEALTLGTAIDGRADLYAVGVMLYQMLTGNIPRGAFKPASVLVPGLDPRFDPIIVKAMQHDRAERHQSAAELRRELDVILTVPFVRNDAPASAAIPVAQMAQAPGQRSAAQKPAPQSRPGVATARPAAGGTASDGRAKATPVLQPKSKTPLFIGLGLAAAIGIGSFVMSGGGKKDVARLSKVESVSPPAPQPPTLESRATANPPPKPAYSSPTPTVSKSSVATATKDAPFINTLGMKFVPIAHGSSVLFSIWETRRRDYATFASAKNVDASWKTQVKDGLPISDSGDHPVVGVNFNDAKAFCGWLNEKEAAEGRLPPGMKYRLPTDLEWSTAAGLLKEGGTTPAERDGKDTTLFPWGTLWPPHSGVGNYADAAFHAQFPLQGDQNRWIEGYKDGFDRTASVGQFPPTWSGIYDLGGSVWEWCLDSYNGDDAVHVSRGASWRDSQKDQLLTSHRRHENRDTRGSAVGFRVALAPATSEPSTKVATASATVASSPNPPASKSASAPVSSSPSLPISPSSDSKFPPGQWVKVFAKAEDLPEDLRKPDSGVKWEDGWVVVPDGIKSPYITLGPKDSPKRNWGMRATFRAGSAFEMRVRDTATPLEQFYGSKGFNIYHATRKNGDMLPMTLKESPTKLSPEADHVVTFAAVGSHLIGRKDDDSVFTAQNNAILEGHLRLLNLKGAVSDIEVINLDGLSEAEALKILGVDEKGNDLRALAAKQEQQMAEQAKVVDAASAIPELKALHEQFVKLQAERVTAPFEAEVAKLNAGYVGGIDREIASEKKAGHLDGVIALEAEKMLLADKQPVPTEDAATTTEALKKLRGIYRTAYAKIEVARAENLKTLTDPLSLRLKQLEATLTQKDRVPDAKTVREYREELGRADGPPSAAVPSRTALAGASALPSGAPLKPGKVKANPDLSRKAAEYVLIKGGSISIESKGTRIEVKPGDTLPKGSWELLKVKFPDKSTVTDEDLRVVTQAVELREFDPGLASACNLSSLRPFKNTPLMERLRVYSYGEMNQEECAMLSEMPSLTLLSIGGTKPIANLGVIMERLKLEALTLDGRPLSLQDVDAINQMTTLKDLNLTTVATDDMLARLGGLTDLEYLGISRSKVTAAGMQSLNSKLAKRLKRFNAGSPTIDGSTLVAEAIVRFPLLEELMVRGEVNAAALAQLRKLENLHKFHLLQTTITPQHIQAISQCKPLGELRLGNGQLTAADVTELKNLKSLLMLTINDNGITMDSNTLEALGTWKQLKTLELPESQVTPDALAQLRQQLPGCKISLVPKND